MVILSPFLTKLFSLGFARGIMIFPFIFLSKERYKRDKYIINHEKIHYRQAVELLVVGFYLLYTVEFLVRLIQFRQANKAYRNISFEQEAYRHETDLSYLQKRRWWSFLRYY